MLVRSEINYELERAEEVRCQNYSLNEYISINSSVGNQYLKLFNFNIRSFHSNGVEFEALLQVFSELPEFIIVTETWNNQTNFNLCSLDNYNVYHTYRFNNERGGGVSVFALKPIFGEVISDLSYSDENIEICTIKAMYRRGFVLVIGIYRPPAACKNSFISAINRVLNHPKVSNASMVLFGGDFNLDLNTPNRPAIREYLSTMHSNYFYQAITESTRPSVPPSVNSSNLDHIWCNNTRWTHYAGVIPIDLTDHYLCFIHLLCPKFIEDKTKIEFRPYSEPNLSKLIEKLVETNWNSVCGFNEVDSDINNLMGTINKLYCQCFPIKSKFITQKRIDNPWISSNLKSKIKQKHEYFSLYKKGLLSQNTYSIFKNKVSFEIMEAKQKYYITEFQSDSTPKSKWDLIKKLMGCKKNSTYISEMEFNDQIVTDQGEIVEKLNHYFTNIALNLDRNLPDSQDDPAAQIDSNLKTFYLFPVAPQECLRVIKNLKITKSDINHIPVKIFKLVAPYLIEPLCKLINLSFSTGVFPKLFKIARITPIFKSGDRKMPTNYRPISSIPYLSKVFEKCICIRLLKFFDKFSLFSNCQHGFRKGRTTCDALLSLTESIYENLNRREYLVSSLVDLRKAFDTVSHPILVRKLAKYGVRGVSLSLITSFLKDRKQFVSLGSNSSSLMNVRIGVPQGSTLGPVLFLIYVNDLPTISDILKFSLFADDTAITISNKDCNDLVMTLNDELHKLSQYTVLNRLSINVDKTKSIVFSNKNSENILNSSISICNQNVEFTKNVTYLGIKLNNKLDFSDQVDFVVDKVAKQTGILFKIRKNLDIRTRLTFYYSFIYPHLIYNVLIWGGAYPTVIQKLVVQHKKTIRTIADIPYNGHTSSTFRMYKILKFSDIYKYHVLIYMYKNRSKPIFNVQHDVSTRNRNNLVSSFQRLKRTQNSVYYIGPKFWNELPNRVRNSSRLCEFKNNLKEHLVAAYV